MPGFASSVQDDRGVGLVGGGYRDPVHPALFDIVSDLEAEGVLTAGQRRVRVKVHGQSLVNDEADGRDVSRGSRGALLHS